MLLKDMVKNPRTGALVAPDWAEPVDPRPPLDLVDGISLREMAPRRDLVATISYVGNLIDPATGDAMRPLVAKFWLGRAVGVVT